MSSKSGCSAFKTAAEYQCSRRVVLCNADEGVACLKYKGHKKGKQCHACTLGLLPLSAVVLMGQHAGMVQNHEVWLADVQGYESTLTSPEPPMSGEKLMGAGSKSLAGKHPFYTLMTLPLRNGLGIRHWAKLKFLHFLGILGNSFYSKTLATQILQTDTPDALAFL
jgi:hypothetical protein